MSLTKMIANRQVRNIGLNYKLQWKQIYSLLYENVKDNFLRWFQLRILHNILATNNFLYKIKILNFEKCTFCNNFPETIDHLFWKCETVQIFHNKIKDILEKTDAQCRPEEMSFVLGNLENRNHYLFILEIKSFIYW